MIEYRRGSGGLRQRARRFGIIHAMKIDERCLPYAEEMKTCGYCAEGEYLAAYGIRRNQAAKGGKGA